MSPGPGDSRYGRHTGRGHGGAFWRRGEAMEGGDINGNFYGLYIYMGYIMLYMDIYIYNIYIYIYIYIWVI